MTPELPVALQAQAGREFSASQTYLSLSLWAGSAGYPGAQSWLAAASDDERSHGQKLLAYLNDFHDTLPECPSVPERRLQPESLAACFRSVLLLELQVTEAINALSALALEEGDHLAYAFLQWFRAEQIGSVSEVRNWVRELEQAAGDVAATKLIDSRLGEA